MNTIGYCLKHEVCKINTLLIFVSFTIGVTTDDVESIKTFMDNFGHSDIKIGLCVSRSENVTEDGKSKHSSSLLVSFLTLGREDD